MEKKRGRSSRADFISLCSDHNDDFFVRRIYERFFDGIVVASVSFTDFPLHAEFFDLTKL